MRLHDGAGLFAEILPWEGWTCDAPASEWDMLTRLDSETGSWRDDSPANTDVCLRHARRTIGCYHLCDEHAPLIPEFAERWIREGRPERHPMEF